MEKVDEIRQAGFGIGYGNYVDEAAVINWPLIGTGRVPPLVLSIGGPAESIRAAERQIIGRMMALLQNHGYQVRPRR